MTPVAVRDLYAVLLGRPDATTEDSFVALGGDSLSFVEASTRLGRMLGHLPAGWQYRSAAELAATARRPRRLLTPVEMPALLRAVAIVLILVTHVDLVLVPGGAHVLLAVAGYNLARFTLAGAEGRVRRVLGTLAAVALPSAAWIAGAAVLTGDYDAATAVFLNQLLGPDQWDLNWQYWFLEALVWTYVGLTALVLVRPLDRWWRGHRFVSALVVTLACLGVRYAWTGVETGPTERYTVGLVLWCVALGWAAAEARSPAQRVVVAVLALAGSWGFFGDPQREVVVAAGIVLLLWSRSLLLPRGVAGVVLVIADCSLWIYLTHWQVYPDLEAAGHPWLGLFASLVVGVAAAYLYRALTPVVGRRIRREAGTDPGSRESVGSRD